jgi:hypothetical protein
VLLNVAKLLLAQIQFFSKVLIRNALVVQSSPITGCETGYWFAVSTNNYDYCGQQSFASTRFATPMDKRQTGLFALIQALSFLAENPIACQLVRSNYLLVKRRVTRRTDLETWRFGVSGVSIFSGQPISLHSVSVFAKKVLAV